MSRSFTAAGMDELLHDRIDCQHDLKQQEGFLP
jgi:hypothetical protein